MSKQFIDVNIPALTFQGLSRPVHRKIALSATLGVLAMLVYLSWVGGQLLNGLGLAEDLSMILTFLVISAYIGWNKFLPLWLAKVVLKNSPLGVLYRQDMKVVQLARDECMAVSRAVNFSDYLEYAKINPAICSQDSGVVMQAQAKGQIQRWSKNVHNLKSVANLIYQIHLVEQFLIADQE